MASPIFPNLLIGNDKKDDAAVMDMGNGNALINTLDFFMPIVDDAYAFGQIASVNAINDVYAMGGKPIMALGILGWPINKIPAAEAARVLEGSRAVCQRIGIPLAGGHSIDAPEPIFGLAVTGTAPIENIKSNASATAACQLYLTKPLGIGILTTAQKKQLLQKDHEQVVLDLMMRLNDVGEQLAALPYVKSMTDVTGFGLLGHLIEMCEASNISAELMFDQVPLIGLDLLNSYIEQRSVPGGTKRNWDSFKEKALVPDEFHRTILCDPQTSGGLLVAVDERHAKAFEDFATRAAGLMLSPLGRTTEAQDFVVICTN